MTRARQAVGRLLTIDDFVALGEDDDRWELQEGTLVMSPSPSPEHTTASLRLFNQLEAQLSDEVRVVLEVDVDLELAGRDQPGSSRRPDLLVVTQAAIARRRREGGLLRASEVRLVVEVVSPGSGRMDHVIKRGEYADAGIPHYWVIDLDPPVSMVAYHLAGEFGYADVGAVTGVVELGEPFTLRIDLNALD
jgi:Uma2 family endonuclease